MHPDNNPPQLGSGQLFLTDPATGQTVPLGYSTAEITTQEPEKDVLGEELPAVRITNPPAEISIELEPMSAEAFEKFMQPWVAAYREWLQQLIDVQHNACMKWAQEHRRKLLHIGRTTKKARTRKKIATRIWRDYKAARAAALARIAGED